MRKSTRVALIALAILIVPAIYSGYLLYRESKSVDYVSVMVVDHKERAVSGVLVSLFPQWEKAPFVSINDITRDGVVNFQNIPPGEYEIRVYEKKECDSFRIRIESARVHIQVPLYECSITMIIAPK